jgi:SAM-dependent methyltransferase
VGSEGRVVATDIDTSLLESRDDSRLEVVRSDVLVDDLPAADFDLVHCRAVLVHLSDPRHALERMAGCLKPGGVLVAEEPWTDVAQLSPDPVLAEAAEALGETLDGSFARRLPLVLREIGLERVRADAELRFFDGGTNLAAFYRRALEGACTRRVAAGSLDAARVRELQGRFDDPGFRDCGWPHIGAVGWMPDPVPA